MQPPLDSSTVNQWRGQLQMDQQIVRSAIDRAIPPSTQADIVFFRWGRLPQWRTVPHTSTVEQQLKIIACKIRPAGCTKVQSINLGTFTLPIHGQNIVRLLLNWLRFELSMVSFSFLSFSPPAQPKNFNCVQPALVSILPRQTVQFARTSSFYTTMKQYSLVVEPLPVHAGKVPVSSHKLLFLLVLLL